MAFLQNSCFSFFFKYLILIWMPLLLTSSSFIKAEGIENTFKNHLERILTPDYLMVAFKAF